MNNVEEVVHSKQVEWKNITVLGFKLQLSSQGEVRTWTKKDNLYLLRSVTVLHAPYPALKIPTLDGYKFVAIHRLMLVAFPTIIRRDRVNVTGKPAGEQK